MLTKSALHRKFEISEDTKIYNPNFKIPSQHLHAQS